MESFRNILIASATELGYGPDRFTPLGAEKTPEVAAAVKQAFGEAANGAIVGWWHSDQPCPVPKASRHFPDGGWRHLVAIAPDTTAPVWLLAENWWRGHPPLFAFASTAEVVQAVLRNMHGFEYVVAGRELDWLFAEDHHDGVYVAGIRAVERLQLLAEVSQAGE